MPKTIVKNFITKYNICVLWYIQKIEEVLSQEQDFISQNSEYSEILTHVKNTLNSNDETTNKEIFQFVKETLGKFSNTYDINVMINVDDFKILYFITLYFVREDQTTKGRKALNVLFFTLHKLFCHLLIAEKPSIMLEKFDRFFKSYNYEKIKNEYGDIGYYHAIKSIYLMQKEVYEDLIKNNVFSLKDPFIMNYLGGNNNASR